MHNNDILKIQYNQSSCKDARLLSYGRMTSPSFKAKASKNAEKQITDETLKIASAAIAASGMFYLGSGKTRQSSQLSRKQQEEILEKYKQGYAPRVIAEEYGCSTDLIRYLIKKQPNRKELNEQNSASNLKTGGKIVYLGNSGHYTSMFSEAQQEEIVERYEKGETSSALSREFGGSMGLIDALIRKQPNAKELRAAHEKNKAFFSEEQEKEIIEKYKNGISSEILAKEYNCPPKRITTLINKQPNAKELKELSKKNRACFSEEQISTIIERYVQGEPFSAIAKDYNVYPGTINAIILKQPNAKELKANSMKNRKSLKDSILKAIIERFVNGESYESISKDYELSAQTLIRIISELPNAEELKKQHKENQEFFSQKEKSEIIERFASGESCETIARDYKCAEEYISKLINSLPNAEELKKQNKINKGIFSPERKKDIINRYIKGESFNSIARIYNCSPTTVNDFISGLSNYEELREKHELNKKTDYSRKNYTQAQINEIVQKFTAGKSYSALAREYGCAMGTITRIINQQDNADYIKNKNKINRKIFSKNDEIVIINRYKNGESPLAIARDYKRTGNTVVRLINQSENAEEIKFIHNQNVSQTYLKAKISEIIKNYRAGKSCREIAKELDCASATIATLIKEQPNIDDIRLEHNKNNALFSDTDIIEILNKFTHGVSRYKISLEYNCAENTIWKIIQTELNKNKEGTTKETFWHKYEEYSIDELKTRISEFVSLKQVEENDELLEIMFFLDEKAKFGEDEKALSIDFIRLLDKLEQQKASTKNVIESQTVKDLFDLMDKDLIKQQVFEELNKDYNAAIDELNLTGNEALGDICSKYIAHNIDDEDNIASMKTILNIISSNDEKAIRHKLVAFDNMKQNPNDERIKEAEEIYGEDNQEKIGQYIIFDQVLKGEYTNTDFDNDVLKFVDELKDMHLNKDAIIKRLIELEDYFNSKEAQNNSLTNFIKHFNLNDNYINKLLTDFYIDNIYKDKITTIEVTADSKYFSGENITLMIYPEAKQATLSNTEVNFDKHLFLIDSEEYAKYFASRKLGSLGVKIFTLDKSYQKEGFYSGDNVLEIKVPNGYNGARLAAKIKKEDDRVFEIKYFMSNGFHREKKRTDL